MKDGNRLTEEIRGTPRDTDGVPSPPAAKRAGGKFALIIGTTEKLIWFALFATAFLYFSEKDNWAALVSLLGLFIALLSFIYVFRSSPLFFLAASLKRAESVAPAVGMDCVVFLLRGRAQRLRFMAIGTLVILIVCLTSGLLVFIFAEQFTNIKYIQQSSLIAVLDRQSNSITRAQEQINAILSSATRTLENANRVLTSEPKDLSSRDYDVFRAVRNSLDPDTIRIMRVYVDEMRSEQLSFLKAIGDIQKSLVGENGSQGGQKDREPYAAFFARFGSLVILFLSVQVFGRLYRFNLSLASDYDAVADTLSLYQLNLTNEKLEDFVKKMRDLVKPTNIDLPEVKSPLEYVFGWRKADPPRRQSRKKASASVIGKKNGQAQTPGPPVER